MIKKTTAIFFILLANIIILAHAAFPHNHIHGLVNMFDEQLHSNGVSHEHHNSDSNNGSGQNEADFCLLNQAVQAGRNETAINFQDYEEHIINDFILRSGIEIIFPHFFNIPPPFFEVSPSLYSFLFKSGTGLRAPPVV